MQAEELPNAPKVDNGWHLLFGKFLDPVPQIESVRNTLGEVLGFFKKTGIQELCSYSYKNSSYVVARLCLEYEVISFRITRLINEAEKLAQDLERIKGLVDEYLWHRNAALLGYDPGVLKKKLVETVNKIAYEIMREYNQYREISVLNDIILDIMRKHLSEMFGHNPEIRGGYGEEVTPWIHSKREFAVRLGKASFNIIFAMSFEERKRRRKRKEQEIITMTEIKAYVFPDDPG